MNLNKIKPQKNYLSLVKVRLIARLKGDGSCFVAGRKHRTNYNLRYESANLDEVLSFANDIREVYGLEPKFAMHRSGKVPTKKLPVAFVLSKLAYEDIIKYGPFDSYTWRVPKEILDGTKKMKIEFIRTFAEDEGTVVHRNKVVKIYSINILGIKEISSMLFTLGVNNRINGGYGAKRNIYAIVISKKVNLLKFAKIIGFRSKIKNVKLNNLLLSYKH